MLVVVACSLMVNVIAVSRILEIKQRGSHVIGLTIWYILLITLFPTHLRYCSLDHTLMRPMLGELSEVLSIHNWSSLSFMNFLSSLKVSI